MMKKYFEELEKGLTDAIRTGKPSARKRYSLEIARLGGRLYSGTDKVAWCGIAAPFDLLNSMGVTSCFVEFIGAMLASTGMVGEFLEEADHAGYSSDSCSYHRAVTGATMKGIMPAPEFLVGTTNPCSGGLAVIENLARHFGKDFFVLHIPQDDSRRSVRFLADQMRDLVRFTERITGTPLDHDTLKLTILNSNRVWEVIREVYDLAKLVPSPVASRDLANFGIVMSLFQGRESAISVAEAFRDELAERVANSAMAPLPEKFRILWIQNRIQFKHPLEKMLEEHYHARIVIDELNDITWDPIDPGSPFEGMARRSISIPFNGPVEKRIGHLQKLAGEYQIHGAINPCNWGCRQGTGGRGLIEDGLRKIGIPVLNLEVDCVDPRKFTPGQFQTRVEAFVEMMQSRPSPWA
ncbi:MAG TPA: 2-hydroxyacyl-CoA dehydratase family protein [Spirochaetota bacterium]|nr:2-hydroxyacyl-CoA dehydratase family protein [Spirochaetota bacterium]